MQKHVIEIPDGTEFVEAANIPSWIADRLVPIPDTSAALCRLQKRTLIGDGHWHAEELTAEDYSLLDAICCDLPAVSRDTTMEQWQNYRLAFEHASNKPAWTVHAQFTNFIEQSRIERSNARREHFDLMDAAIRSGTLKVLTDRRTPASKVEPGSIIRIEDARSYLAPLGFALRETSQATEQALPQPEAPPVSQAQESANDVGQNATVKPLQRQRFQEQEILRIIRTLGYEAKMLPKCKPGKPGIKAKVRPNLSFSVKVFDRAWERLRKQEEIQDAL